MSEKKKIENPGLVWAIEQLRIQRTKQAEAQLFEELRRAVFLVPAVVKPVGEPGEPNEKGERKMKAEVRLRMITSKGDGVKVIPLFTDDEQKAKGEEGEGQKPTYIPMRLADAAQAALADPQLTGVVVNPYGASIRLNKAQIRAVLGLPQEKVEVRVGQPNQLPEGLIERLTAVLAGEEKVSRAWLRFLERGQEKGFLCVVDGVSEEAAVKELFGRLAEAAKPYPQGLKFFAAPFSNPFGAKSVEKALPFYERDAQVM